MRADRFLAGVGFDADTVVAVAIPVADDGGQGRDHPVGLVLLLGEVVFRLEVAEEGYAGPQHVHRVRAGRNQFEHTLQRLRQFPQGGEPLAVAGELLAIRQFPVEE